MTIVKAKTNILPVKVAQLIHGTWATQVLRSAVELNIFDQLEAQAADVSTIAKAIQADKRALEMLLDALVSIGLLHKNGNQYSLTEESRLYLLSSSSIYIGRYLQMNQEGEEIWQGLSGVVRSGKPLDQVNKSKRAQEFFPSLAEIIFPMNFVLAERVAAEIKVTQLPAQSKVLDVAAGAATWSIPMALSNKALHVDALDFPSTLEVTKKYATKYGVADRYHYISGSWQEVSWKKNAYDVIILGHILHSEGRELSTQLIQQCYDALKPSGVLVIAEFIANNDRNGPPVAMLFGVNMLIRTTEGCVFTDAELNEMLSAAGFSKTHRMPIEETPASPIMIAYK